MDIGTAAFLLAAGLAGGLANAIAGGATLITFPAMLAAGLPPIVANASNAVAVTPGHFVAALVDRQRLPPAGMAFAAIIVAAFVSGVAGALLLLFTPEKLFTLLVPPLIAFATLVFAFSRQIQAAFARFAFGAQGKQGGLRAALLIPTAIYGGYFGAGLGVMLLAVLSVTGSTDVRAANALKNMLATAVSAATLLVFAAQGVVHWPSTLVMLAGAVCGGLAGGHLVRLLPPQVVRAVVITVGTGMAVLYTWRYWL